MTFLIISSLGFEKFYEKSLTRIIKEFKYNWDQI